MDERISELWYTTKTGRKKVAYFTGETKTAGIIDGIGFITRNYRNITPTAGSWQLLDAWGEFMKLDKWNKEVQHGK